jgi:hypothetical protein
MTTWLARAFDGRELVIEAQAQGDARTTALRLFALEQRTELIVVPTLVANPQIELRWMPGTTVPEHTLRPMLRQWVGSGWTPWVDEYDFTLDASLLSTAAARR